MRKSLKFLVLCGVVLAMTTGCAKRESAKVAASVDQDFINAYDAFEMAKNPRAKVASEHLPTRPTGVDWLHH